MILNKNKLLANNDLALLFIRVAVSMSMIIVHGFKKVIDIHGTIEHIPDPLGIGNTASAIISIIANIVAPVFVILGYKARLATIPTLGVTLTGLILVHWGDPLAVRDVPYLYSIVFLFILLAGPGKYSIDNIRFKSPDKKITQLSTVLLTVIVLASCSDKEAMQADLIVKNANIITLDDEIPRASAVAIKEGEIIYVGNEELAEDYKSEETRIIDAQGKMMIPGLNDSHLHHIRGGLNYNLELRWDGVTSIKRALEMLKEQANRTPEGQWVRVVGGWSEFQFEERRLPTLQEINEAVPDKPVFILYLYSLGFMNKAGLEYVGYDSLTSYPGGEIQLDSEGIPTGLLVAKPSALILYSTLVKGPSLTREEQINSTMQYMRELNRLGITSAIDAGGGGQYYPNNYEVAQQLAKEGKLTVRTAYYLFAQKKGKELESFKNWTSQVSPRHNDDLFKPNGYMMHGAGENLTWAAADFENFLEPRPHLGEHMEGELKPIIELLVSKRWPFRIHATYGESIERFLDVFEEVNDSIPFDGLRWIVDHGETVTDQQLERIKNLGGGIAIQNRMAFQGEYFIDRYGAQEASNTPPFSKMIDKGLPVGLGTDGTRVSSYNPWYSIYWLASGKTMGGTQLYPRERLLSRESILKLMTRGSAWFSSEENVKGSIKKGMYADLILLNQDFLSIDDEKIKQMESLLTIVNGKVVFAQNEFSYLDPGVPSAIPKWSPVNYYQSIGGQQKKQIR